MKSDNLYFSALWMLGAIVAFSMTAVAGREATDVLNEHAMSISQLVFFRNVMGLCIISFLVFKFSTVHERRLSRSAFKLHVGRNTSHFIGQWCWFYGLSLLPLATVFAIEFTVPIWTAIFASILLSERVSWRRSISILFGFAGVLMILRPGFISVPDAVWIVLASAVAYGLSHTLTKKLTGQASALMVIFYMHVMQLPLALFLVSFDFDWPAGIIWLYVLMTAVAALMAHFCMTKALSYGDAMLVMPMDFLRLPLIALIGVILYNESIDLWLVMGAGIMLVGNIISLKEKPDIKPVKAISE